MFRRLEDVRFKNLFFGLCVVIDVLNSESKTKFSYGVLAGVQYNLADNLWLNAGIEDNYLGKIEDIKVHQYSAKVGLRCSF